MKKLFLIIFALAMTLAVFADAYTIGTGTSNQSYIPFYGLYDYSWSKVIYTAAEMTTAGVPANSTITGISFYVGNTPVNYIAEDQRVYVRHTADTVINTDYVANPLTDFTEVWVGDLTWNGGGWHNILFTNTFTWNGTDNLEILWYNWDGAYQSGPNFRYTTTTTNLACYKYADANMPTTVGTATTSRPNIRILDANVSIPGPVSALLTPANAALNVAQPTQFSWSAPTTGGIPTGYNLYIKANDDNFTGVTPIAVTAASHSITLDYSTQYYWKVIATNTAGDSPDSDIWSFTTRDDPTKPIPYIQDFNSGTSLTAIDWTGDMYIAANHGTNGSNGLYKNLYSYTTTTNAVTPIVGPMVTDSQLMFDYRYVAYSNYPNTPLTLAAGDKLEILVAPAGGTFTTIHTIDQNNHVTSTNFTNVIVPISGFGGQTIQVKFLATWGAADYYLDIDNVTIRETPTGGVLVVSPSPVAMGSGYVGISKTRQVALTNTGAAAFTVNSIALASTVDFQLQNLPTLPVTINPGDPAVTFTVVFTPTTAGEFSTQLLIGDTRANSSISVTGTGVQPLEGEICEFPYVVTLPLVDYDGTTEGYANDYTSAMFTGLTSASYVSGKDWVAKITVPTLGNLNITLADQTGYSSQWMGMFLVNTIPSLDTPAAVLAQAYGSSTPLSIANHTVTPGDYYLIVDNWPTPANVYFTLNISFDAASEPPNAAIQPSPTDGATNLSLTPTLSWSSGGGVVEKYYVSYGTVDPFSTIVNDHDNETATTYSITTALEYQTEYWWKVVPWNSVGEYAQNPDTWTFTTLANPTISSFPFFEGFEVGYTNGASVLGNWEQLVGPEYSSVYWTANNTNTTYNREPRSGDWNATLRYNGEAVLVRPIQLEAGTDYQIEFYARQDTDTSTAAKIQAKLGDAPTLAALITEITPQTGLVSGDYQEISGTFSVAADGIYYIGIGGWLNITPWYISLDDITIREVVGGPPVAPILVYPADREDDLPKVGFNLTWQPDLDNGGVPTNYEVFLSMDENAIFDEYSPIEVVGDTFCNPIQDGEIEFEYNDIWYWTVVAYNSHGGSFDHGDINLVPIHSFTIESNPTVTEFPWCVDFENVPTQGFPLTGWTTQTVQGGKSWQATTAYNHTPGGSYSAQYPYGSTFEEGWLITPPIVLPAGGGDLTFWHYSYWPTYYDYSGVLVTTGNPDPVTGNWTELWNPASVTASWVQESISLTAYGGDTIHLAFVYEGNNAHDWMIDDICITEALDHDVAVTALIEPTGEVINTSAGNIDIKVRVDNLGANTESFEVEMLYGETYRSASVSNLAAGNHDIVTFANVEPVVGLELIYVAIDMAGDENPDNDELLMLLYGAPLDKTAYGDILYSDGSVVPTGLATFNLSDPQTIIPLTAPNPMQASLFAADWIDDGWWGAEYQYDWWHISVPDGTPTYQGTHGLDIRGVAWDPYNDIVYATEGTNLLILDKETGAPTVIGNLTWSVFGTPLTNAGLLQSIAFDNATQTLYGLDMNYDAVFTIDPVTLDCAALGLTLGWDIAYAQDMAFDQDSGLLYIAGCTAVDGMLLLVNTSVGHSFDDDPVNLYMGESYLIDFFDANAEVDGFVIPYGDELESPELTMAEGGNLSWDDVGAPMYKIYRSEDPYTGFALVASTANSYWQDPDYDDFREVFYHITAAEGVKAGRQANITTFNNIHSLKKENILNPNAFKDKPEHPRRIRETPTGKKVK